MGCPVPLPHHCSLPKPVVLGQGAPENRRQRLTQGILPQNSTSPGPGAQPKPSSSGDPTVYLVQPSSACTYPGHSRQCCHSCQSLVCHLMVSLGRLSFCRKASAQERMQLGSASSSLVFSARASQAWLSPQSIHGGLLGTGTCPSRTRPNSQGAHSLAPMGPH